MKFVVMFLPLSALISAGCSGDTSGGDTQASNATGSASSTGCYDPAGATGTAGVDNCGGSVGGVSDGAGSDGPGSSGPVDPTPGDETEDSGDPPGDCVMAGMLPDAYFEGTVSGAHTGTYTLDLPMGTAGPDGEAVNGGYNSALGLFSMQALGGRSEWQFGLASAEPTAVVPGTYDMNTGTIDIGGFALPTVPDGWVSTAGTITISDVVPHCGGAPAVYIDGSFAFDAANDKTGTAIAATGSFSGVFVAVG